jgi:GxxExxY protein
MDIVVQPNLILETKSVEQVLRIHKAQLLIYLRRSGRSVGLLTDLDTVVLKHGPCRMVR